MDPEPGRSNLRSSRLPMAVLLAVAAAALAGGALWMWRMREPAPAPLVATATAEPTVAASTAAVDDAVAAEAPPLDAQSARAALEAASPSPTFRSWLGHGDLVRQWLTVTANLAEGESPRVVLRFLAPGTPFTAVARGDRLAIAAESYARYDAFADAVGSVDAATVASVYRRLHPVLEQGWRALGLSAHPLDVATGRALRRIAGAPVPDGDVLVRAADGVYEYADPRLEALGEVEKHLVRMGPRNERILQAKARAILDALQLPLVASKRR